MSGLTAIPTIYEGIQFRSRAEARWAVALDEAGVEWVYEPEGFKLASHWYLPDFWFPRMRCFAEVKGVSAQFDAVAMAKATELASASGCPVLLLTDLIETEEGIPWAPFVPQLIGGHEYIDILASERKGRPFYQHDDPKVCAQDQAFIDPTWKMAQWVSAHYFQLSWQ